MTFEEFEKELDALSDHVCWTPYVDIHGSGAITIDGNFRNTEHLKAVVALIERYQSH